MAEKKRTFTCKACGGEHMGLICTKFRSVRVLDPPARKEKIAGLLAAPVPAKAPKKAKAKKRKKKAKKKRDKRSANGSATKQASTAQPIAAPEQIETVAADIQPDKTGDNS